MSKFDFCVDCRKVIPATENSHVDRPGDQPRCAECAAKRETAAQPAGFYDPATNVGKAFILIAKAKAAAMALAEHPGFHSDLWYETFVTVGFTNLEALNIATNDPEDVCLIGMVHCDHICHLMTALEDVDRNRIETLYWMDTWRPLRAARRAFDAELELISEAKETAIQEVK